MQVSPQGQTKQLKRVTGVKTLALILVSYVNEFGEHTTQLAIVGDNNVHLLESRAFGMTKNSTPQGKAAKWLADEILDAVKGASNGSKKSKAA